jgi:hypothetical protein
MSSPRYKDGRATTSAIQSAKQLINMKYHTKKKKATLWTQQYAHDTDQCKVIDSQADKMQALWQG